MARGQRYSAIGRVRLRLRLRLRLRVRVRVRVARAVLGVGDEAVGEEHLRVAQLRAVPPAQQTPRVCREVS